MLNITKTNSPTFYEDYKNSEAINNYNDLTGEIRQQLRRHMLTNEQHIDDHNFCTYCEKLIYDNSESNCHLDHVKPKGNNTYSALQLEYTNFTVSCNTKDTCGGRKKSRYLPNFVNPLEDDFNNYFTYEVSTGEIIEKTAEYRDKLKDTNEMINFNKYGLLNARKNTIKEILAMKDKENRDDVLNHYFALSPTFRTWLLQLD